jgi:hypothetical protein
VGHDAGTPSGWTVTGEITVSNPNDWQDITVDVTDAVDNGGVCTVDGGTAVEVPRSDSVTLDYSCTYASAPTADEGTNTATATWDGAAAHTPSSSADGTAAFDFGAVEPNLIDECVSVSDPIDPNSPHSFCVGDTGDPTFSFTYTRTVNAPTLGSCVEYDNTATFTTIDTGTTGSDSQTVEVCNVRQPLTPGYWKTHLGPTAACRGLSLPQGTGCSNNGPWANQYFTNLTLGTYPVNSIQKAAQVFAAMNCGTSTDQSAIGCLAGHLLAAKLNVANGANSCISATIAKADAFLSGQTVDGVPGINYTGPGVTYVLSAAQRALAISLKTALDTYNNGGGCP